MSGDPSAGAPTLSSAPMTETTLTYETACARIEDIIRRLDSGEAGLRETLELCQEGRRLVEFCAGELEAVGRGLEELKLDELVTRLEAGRHPRLSLRMADGSLPVRPGPAPPVLSTPSTPSAPSVPPARSAHIGPAEHDRVRDPP